MDAKELRKALAKLPVITVGTIAQDHQIIEGNGNGAHYKITKETTPKLSSLVMYFLSVSGSEESRQKLISRFIEILGSPLNQYQTKVLPGIDFVCWNAEEIDKKAVN